MYLIPIALAALAVPVHRPIVGLGGHVDEWTYSWVYDDPNIGRYRSFNYEIGVTTNTAPGTLGYGGIYTRFKSDTAGPTPGLFSSFMIDGYDNNGVKTRAFWIVTPHDKPSQSAMGGVQLQAFYFSDQNGTPVMAASMAERAFYMEDSRTVYRASGMPTWSTGMSTQGNYVISNSNALTSPAISILPGSRQVVFQAPIQLAAFSTTTLPSANSVGAGAMVYVSDGAGQLAYSNGATWNYSSGTPVNSTVTSASQSAKIPVGSTDSFAPDALTDGLDRLGGDVRRATGGVAAAMALGGVFLPPDKNFAISFNLATFAGQRGYAASAVGKVGPAVYLNAGVAGSSAKNSTGARVGVTFGF